MYRYNNPEKPQTGFVAALMSAVPLSAKVENPMQRLHKIDILKINGLTFNEAIEC